MKNALKLFVAVAVPAALLMAGNADARKWGRHGHGKRFFSKLVKVGALTPADIAGAKAARKDFKACRKEARANNAARGTCRAKFLEVVKARLALLEKAKASGKLEGRFAKRIDRKIKRLSRRLARIQKRMSAPPAP